MATTNLAKFPQVESAIDDSKTDDNEDRMWQTGWRKHLDVAERVYGKQSEELELLSRLPISNKERCALLLDLMSMKK